MSRFTIIILLIAGALFAGAVYRLVKTSAKDPIRGERSDTAVLLLLVLLGVGGSTARDRFPLNSRNYWFANAALIPICVAAVWYIWRLVRAFKGAPPRSTKSTARLLKPPKID